MTPAIVGPDSGRFCHNCCKCGAHGPIGQDWEEAAQKTVVPANEIESLREEIRRLRAALHEVRDLILESTGVYGLHLNGDPAPWAELIYPGRYGEWLAKFQEETGIEVR